MIRDAQLEDIPRMVEMGRRFRRESSYEKHLTDNPERMAELGKRLISNQSLIVAENEGVIVGMMGFFIHEHFMSGDKMVGEVFWWVDPEYRGRDGIRLLAEMKRRGKLFGCKLYQLVAPNKKVAEFCEKTGCEWLESTYQGVL